MTAITSSIAAMLVRAVAFFHSPEGLTRLGATDPLGGGAVLPGFVLPLGDLFADLDRQGDR